MFPRCYSYYDRRFNEYEFGCYSEASLQVQELCDIDWFNSTCTMCYTSFCNTHLFANEAELQCIGESYVEVGCPYAMDNFPIYMCFYERERNGDPNYKTFGCTSKRFKNNIKEWMNLMDVNYKHRKVMFICASNSCNGKYDESKLIVGWHCLFSYIMNYFPSRGHILLQRSCSIL